MSRFVASMLHRAGGRLSAAMLLLLATATATAAGAAEMKVATTPDGVAAAAPLRIADGKILLTLDEAVEMALRQNLDLRVDRLSREQFRLGITGAKGLFDLRLSGFGQWAESTSSATSALEGAAVPKAQQQVFNLGLAQLTPIGGDLSLQFNNNRLKTNNSFLSFNPAFQVGTNLTYTLPLLRNFGVTTTKRNILVARLQSAGNREQFETQVAAVIQQVENAYWDLVEAIDQLGVAHEALDLAEELHRRNKIQVEVGTLPPLELVQSEANIATQQEQIITARAAVGNAADALRLLLNVDQGPAWDAEITPETDPKTEAIEVSLDEAIKTALAARAELKQQRFAVQRLEVDSKYFRNQTRPRLDLGVTYGQSGAGGPLLTQDPDTGETLSIPGGWSDAFNQATSGDFYSWTFDVTFAYPLQNRAARAQSLSANLEVERARAGLTQLQQQVITQVRTAVRGVTTAAQQIESAGVSRRLQERNLEAEQKRYENGMSTSFQVTQIQEQLTLAKSREVTAIASYRRALSQYYLVVGRLLRETGVELAEPGEAPAGAE
jgi:outer membrane protein